LGVAEPGKKIRKWGADCLSEASFAAPEFSSPAQGTRRDAHGGTWVWVLLPKQKYLGGGDETSHNNKTFLCHPEWNEGSVVYQQPEQDLDGLAYWRRDPSLRSE